MTVSFLMRLSKRQWRSFCHCLQISSLSVLTRNGFLPPNFRDRRLSSWANCQKMPRWESSKEFCQDHPRTHQQNVSKGQERRKFHSKITRRYPDIQICFAWSAPAIDFKGFNFVSGSLLRFSKTDQSQW